jgi:hypothetical protein
LPLPEELYFSSQPALDGQTDRTVGSIEKCVSEQ